RMTSIHPKFGWVAKVTVFDHPVGPFIHQIRYLKASVPYTPALQQIQDGGGYADPKGYGVDSMIFAAPDKADPSQFWVIAHDSYQNPIQETVALVGNYLN